MFVIMLEDLFCCLSTELLVQQSCLKVLIFLKCGLHFLVNNLLESYLWHKKYFNIDQYVNSKQQFGVDIENAL